MREQNVAIGGTWSRFIEEKAGLFLNLRQAHVLGYLESQNDRC
jgi:hypothetical protein